MVFDRDGGLKHGPFHQEMDDIPELYLIDQQEQPQKTKHVSHQQIPSHLGHVNLNHCATGCAGLIHRNYDLSLHGDFLQISLKSVPSIAKPFSFKCSRKRFLSSFSAYFNDLGSWFNYLSDCNTYKTRFSQYFSNKIVYYKSIKIQISETTFEIT